MISRFRVGVCIPFLLLCSLTGFSQSEGKKYTVPEDTRNTYTVSAFIFRGISLPPENEYLTTSIPRLIIEKLQQIPSHKLTEAELEGYRKRLLDDVRRKAGQDITSYRKRRDELFFISSNRMQYLKEAQTIDAQIAQHSELLEFLEAVEYRDIAVTEEKPLALSLEKSTLLLPAPGNTSDPALASSAQEKNLDLLIYGSIESVQGYLYVQIEAFSALSGSRIAVLQDAVTTTDISDLVEVLTEELADKIFGREWGTLRVTANPETAFVYLDGTLAGTGETTVRYLVPGTYMLRIEQEGFMPAVREVTVNKDAIAEAHVPLTEITRRKVSVSTDPAGADIYVGSIFQGQTPLSINAPLSITLMLIKMPGYRDIQYVFSPSDPASLGFSLVPESILIPAFKKRKNDFYTSLGMFVLSLPFTVGFYGMYQNHEYALTSYNLNDSYRYIFQVYRNVSLYTYYGGLAVSGGLFVNMLFRLFDYIKAGEQTF